MWKKKAVKERPLGQNGKNNGPDAHKIISGPIENKQVEEAPKNEAISPWKS